MYQLFAQVCMIFGMNSNGCFKVFTNILVWYTFWHTVSNVLNAEIKEIIENITSDIISKLTVKIRSLGVVNRFSGVDILQTKNYIKIFNKLYRKYIKREKIGHIL